MLWFKDIKVEFDGIMVFFFFIFVEIGFLGFLIFIFVLLL